MTTSSKALEVAFGLFILVFLSVGVPLFVWRLAVVGPYRSARQRLERLTSEVGGLTIGDAPPASSDALSVLMNRFARRPIARGVRDGLAVELSGHAAQRAQHGTPSVDEPAFTRVAVTHTGISGGDVGISNSANLQVVDFISKTPWGAWSRPILSLAHQRPIEPPWFGSGIAWGDPAAFERFFNRETQAELRAFPRQLTFVAFDGKGTASLGWLGLEEDPAIIEQAFSTGAAILRHAAANGVP